MKKKLLLVLTTLAASLCLCFGLAGCGENSGSSTPDTSGSTQTDPSGKPNPDEGGDEPSDPSGNPNPDENDSHTHSFTNYVYNNDATCTEDGTETAQCERCTETDTRVKQGTALGHEEMDYHAGTATCYAPGTLDYWRCPRCEKDFTDENGTTEMTVYESNVPLEHEMEFHAGTATCASAGTLEYWRCSRCEKDFTDENGTTEMTVYESDVPLGHEFTAENKCVRYEQCAAEWEYTDGLRYQLDTKTNTYEVTGIGTASGDVVIPYGYQGKFVNSIGGSAFKNRSIVATGLQALRFPTA